MDLYLEVSGPPGLTKIEGAAYRRGAHMGGFTVVSAARGQKDCAQTIQINGMLTRGFGGGILVDYRIPSSAMEPTLHCAGPVPGCLGGADDVVGVQVNGASHLRRFDIVVFTMPPEAAANCGEGGTAVKRVIGLPGERAVCLSLAAARRQQPLREGLARSDGGVLRAG